MVSNIKDIRCTTSNKLYHISYMQQRRCGFQFLKPGAFFVFSKEEYIMKLKDTGLTKEQLKEKVNKYMIETKER